MGDQSVVLEAFGIERDLFHAGVAAEGIQLPGISRDCEQSLGQGAESALSTVITVRGQDNRFRFSCYIRVERRRHPTQQIVI
jgi:hypothetical protein